MRDEFINVLKSYVLDKRLFLLTGDLGYGVLEPLEQSLESRFCNAGIAEQNMIGVSAALANEGFLPFVYSISPFIYARAFEQVRNDICFHNLPVCLVGSGAGFGYGTAGSTHHALEDCAITSTLPNMTVYVPCFKNDLKAIIEAQFNQPSPIYIRLARHETKCENFTEYLPYRKILDGNNDIILTLGSISGVYYDYFENIPTEKRPTLWCCAKLPVVESEIPMELAAAIEKSHNFCIVEDHIKVGGFAEQFLYYCITKNIRINNLLHFCATSTYSKIYGSQDFLRQKNTLLPQQVEECIQQNKELEGRKIMNLENEKKAREEILDLVKKYYNDFKRSEKTFTEGDRITYAARVFDEKEMCALVDSSLDFWLTTGRYADEFESKFAKWLGVKYASLVNSGSSANLIAFMALTSPTLGEKSIKRGEEVITVACGFPTTVTPIIQYGAIPVFVDVTIPQYNIDVSQLEKALSDKTKAVMIAHTLGNPFDLKAVKDFCVKNNLWLIEDNCDALGSEYTIDGQTKFTGTIGHIGTSSFYPPHHMTMGEGGAVYTDDPQLHKLINSFRDWGRDCVCPSGMDNICKHRFDGQYGELPKGYDHKYVYSHFGYNLKVTDMQAAIGCEQLVKFPSFIERRRHNRDRLYNALTCITDKIILPEPCENSNPSWFGFLITLKEETGLIRENVVRYIESKNVQTRLLFSGNLIKHPCFDEMRKTGEGYRVIGDLSVTDRVMNQTFWVGVYPGMTDEMIDFMAKTIIEAVNA